MIRRVTPRVTPIQTARDFFSSKVTVFCICAGAAALIPSQSQALELDWSGLFRSELNYIHNYTLNTSGAAPDTVSGRATAGGYYIPGAGSVDANFETLFLKLKPRLVVNDNIYIKWSGGSGAPTTAYLAERVLIRRMSCSTIPTNPAAR